VIIAFVYFNLRSGEVKDLQDKMTAIYYFNPATKSWSMLSTRLSVGPNGDRAIAEIPGFGWYALGITQKDPL